jgi:hypothetical protein
MITVTGNRKGGMDLRGNRNAPECQSIIHYVLLSANIPDYVGFAVVQSTSRWLESFLSPMRAPPARAWALLRE